MKYNIPNLYIANKTRDSQGAALATRVAALELTVDGDSTATPPVPGLVDLVDNFKIITATPDSSTFEITSDIPTGYVPISGVLNESISGSAVYCVIGVGELDASKFYASQYYCNNHQGVQTPLEVTVLCVKKPEE